MTDKLHELVKHVGHSGRNILACCWMRLPMYKYAAHVWAAHQSGPRQLDQIFFELLQNGVTTRSQLAECLGIDDNSFIFAHLDILVREGYVEEAENRYAMTEHGKKFVDGAFMEESFCSEKFTFHWNEVQESVVPKPNKTAKQSDGKGPVKWVKHQGGLAREKLLSVLAESFNHANRSKSMEYHSIDDSDRGGFINSKETNAEYIAIFYESTPNTSGIWRVDLRKVEGDGEPVLCRDLTEAANDHDRPWRSQFEKHLLEMKA